MNQVRDIIVLIVGAIVGAIYHLALVAGAAYLVYYKGASAWIFLVPVYEHEL